MAWACAQFRDEKFHYQTRRRKLTKQDLQKIIALDRKIIRAANFTYVGCNDNIRPEEAERYKPAPTKYGESCPRARVMGEQARSYFFQAKGRRKPGEANGGELKLTNEERYEIAKQGFKKSFKYQDITEQLLQAAKTYDEKQKKFRNDTVC